MRRAVRAGTTLAVLVLTVAAAPGARADFTPFVLASGSTTQQADTASQSVVSADGLYLVYTGSQSGASGIYRKNLQTGELELVAPGVAAGAPSVSADGRYVSFTTTDANPASPDPTAPRECSSVYVRDMTLAADQSNAYTLVSALNGSAAALTYAGSTTSGCPGGGSSAADRVAISGDGSEVAFTVVGQSNLCGSVGSTCVLAPGTTQTPPQQVVVRNLATQTTTLASQTQGSLGGPPQPVMDGAAMTDNAVNPPGGLQNADSGDSTVAISADGSTVAWFGINIPAQAPASSSDQPAGYPNEYAEPLWRNIAAGPNAPIRRVTGGDDPAGPCPGGCPGPLNAQWALGNIQSSGNNIGPERGSFAAFNGFLNGGSITAAVSIPSLDAVTPQLSADGQTVAILSTEPAAGQEPVYPQGNEPSNPSANIFLVNMSPGLSRAQALTRVTAWASNNLDDPSLAGTIENMAISPEGNRVAFVTQRTVYPYSPPALITPEQPAVQFDQLYVADLIDGTLQLVSTGYDGQPANKRVTSPSLSANNGPMTFSSGASNLVYGALSQAPTNGSEVFTTSEIKPPATPGTETISPAPANPAITPEWVIGASVHHRANGSIALDVSVPGAGSLSARARAAVPASARSARHPRRGKGGAHRRTRRARAAIASVKTRSKQHRRRRPVPGTVTRTVAGARALSASAGIVELLLAPGSRYRRLIDTKAGLYAMVRLSFVSAGQPPLTETLPVSFVKPKPKKGGRR